MVTQFHVSKTIPRTQNKIKSSNSDSEIIFVLQVLGKFVIYLIFILLIKSKQCRRTIFSFTKSRLLRAGETTSYTSMSSVPR